MVQINYSGNSYYITAVSVRRLDKVVCVTEEATSLNGQPLAEGKVECWWGSEGGGEPVIQEAL